ncbi:class II glutamine amidotransferase domain-containing protein [Methylococcus geothermalis]|uniref:Uncharacterized protein n=1 Tax=Methylococcus geothermalis TaxID=2681310 RepID=A0A858Q5X2_9GAMM|nr:hypothetical protein [Methylococcus geothermalis]QJD29227.1 hypothetical protein GNH96_04085 [Methylococcus geothermalis]
MTGSIVPASPAKPRVLLELMLAPLRFTNALALAIHGLGHALALFALTRNPSAFSAATILEGIPFGELGRSLLPFGPIPQMSAHPPRIPASLYEGWRCRMVAAAGILANLSALAAASWCLEAHGGDLAVLAWSCFCASSILAMLSVPDLLALVHGAAPYWACGPAFAVRYGLDGEESSPLLVSDRLREMAKILAREASTRGGQSAGFSVLVDKGGAQSVIFDKVVKGKREDIVGVLSERLDGLLGKANREGYRRPQDFEAILLHLRYATGGATHWHNAQPHWYEYYDAMMHHRVEDQALVSQPGEVFNMIAHNGDMDGVYLEFTLDGKKCRHFFTQQEARGVFLSMMPRTSSKGDSDSRSVAEWVDFIYTQGLSYKALRYAYFTAALDYNRDIASGNFNLEPLLRWADAIDLALLNIRKELGQSALAAQARSLADLSAEARHRLREALAREVGATLDADAVGRFVAAFEEAFCHHDLTWVMRTASRDLVGEFALMVCSTLEPRMGVFSLTQAFSLGHNRTRGEIFGSAEPLGVTSTLHQGELDDDALQIYLEDGQYATIEYRAASPSEFIRIYDRAKVDDDFSRPPLPAPKALQPFGEGRETRSRSNWFQVNNNPKISRIHLLPAQGNAVEKDLCEIPFVLKRIVESFERGGENHAAMDRLSQLLFQNLLDPGRDPRMHDLVLYGVDFNQDLLNEFAIALHSVLPGLRIRAENSGNVLKEMKRTEREGIGCYGPSTVFLGVSNSAQTQSTLAVVRKARDLVGAERCFVLSQSFLNSMTEALGQGYHPDDPILPNTFVNLSHLSPDGTSGRRRAEAATIVPVATQAVLTEILINLTQKAIEAYSTLNREVLTGQGGDFDLRSDLQMSDIKAFREFQAAVYGVDIPNRVGCNAAGEPIDSPDADALDSEAASRAENQVEFVRSYAIFAAYIVIATVFGVPVFGLLFSPLAFLAGVGLLAHVLDAALFLTALWLIHLGIRRWQGRPVFERIGARAEVYIDRKYIARIVERYNATLFSNMPAFLTPFFYWADTVRDALHRYGIRAHRGVVTIHRLPDERMGIEEANNAAEENMVYAQLGGIRFNGGQPQSRDKVRQGSCYASASRPYQTVLSDSLAGLRAKYDGKLSPEVFRLINRRLIDLCDGLITEFVIGFRRKEIVNRALWDVIRWIPGASLVHEMLLRNGLDLTNLAGEADTANQAQIQSTKHPVSPVDIHTRTMVPRSTFDALRTEEQAPDDSFAVLVFSEHHLALHLNRHAVLEQPQGRVQEVVLKPGRGADRGKLVSDSGDAPCGRFVGALERVDGEPCLVIDNRGSDLRMAVPLSSLSSEQQHYLAHHYRIGSPSLLEAAA